MEYYLLLLFAIWHEIIYPTHMSALLSLCSLYLGYQTLLLITAILGPSTIFLMLVEALAVATSITPWTSFYLNVFPIVGFTLLCFVATTKVQVHIIYIYIYKYYLICKSIKIYNYDTLQFYCLIISVEMCCHPLSNVCYADDGGIGWHGDRNK